MKFATRLSVWVVILLALLLLGISAHFRAQSIVEPEPFSDFAALGTDVSQPVHDWTLGIHGGAYGLTQWGDSECNFYFGHRIATLDVPASDVAVFLISCAIVSIGGAVLVLLLRRA